MKKLLGILVLGLLLVSCSKFEKEAALEKCADYYFLDSHERYNSIITNYKEDQDYKLIENKIIYYEKEKKIKEIQLKYLNKRFVKENPKPVDNFKLKSPEYPKDKSRMDFYKAQFKIYREASKAYYVDYKKIVKKWRDNKRVYLSQINKEISILESRIKKGKSELPTLRYTLIDKAFKKLQLKDKSKIDIYIEIYTACEKLYNKTPSAFLLEWQS
jgi:hypothetical protein